MSGTGERVEPAAASTVALPDAGTQPPAAAVTPPAAAAAPAAEDWREKRIGQLTARLHERNDVVSQREARIAELEAEAAALRGAVTPPAAAAAAGGLTEEEVERRATEKARTMAAQQTATAEFNRQCNTAVEQGRAAFPDFDAKLGDLRSVVIPGDRTSEDAYWGVVSAALKSGAAPKIIYALGNDKNEAMRIMSLDPESRVMEIAKLAAREGTDADGELPKPITPVGAKGSQHTQIDPTDKDRSDKLTTAEFMKRREAQLARK